MNVGSSSTEASDAIPPSSHRLHVRREPFEYGLLPLPSLIFSDATTALRTLRGRLMAHAHAHAPSQGSSSSEPRIGSADIAQTLDLPLDQAQLVLETLACVLPEQGQATDPLCHASPTAIDSAGANPLDLLIFFYLQSYKKPLIRSHKDAAAVADVWPSNSAFDSLFTTLSPLQVRTSKRTMPSQADEAAHQLAYVQKHLSALLSLLAEPLENDDTSSQVITVEQFNHLGYLVRSAEPGSELLPLSEAAPFFANSDPDMPAAAVSLSQVLDWMLEHLCVTSECASERPWPRENGQPDDMMMDDACGGPSASQSATFNGVNQHRNWYTEGLTFIDGIAKSSVLKEENDISGTCVKVSNCHDAAVYVLAPLKYVSVYGCSDSIIVLGAVGKMVRVEHCERVQLIVATRRICIANCRECLLHLAVNQRPLIIGENHNLQVAPYNTFYPRLESHLVQVGINQGINRWEEQLTLGAVDPHDSLSHAAGVADAQAEGASVLPPDRHMNFVIPKWNDGEGQQENVTTGNPFLLPKPYILAQQQRGKSVESLKQALKTVPLDDGRKQDLSHAIHVHFREWLYSSGYIRQLYEFQGNDRES